jgi:hypothetical protein
VGVVVADNSFRSAKRFTGSRDGFVRFDHIPAELQVGLAIRAMASIPLPPLCYLQALTLTAYVTKKLTTEQRADV